MNKCEHKYVDTSDEGTSSYSCKLDKPGVDVDCKCDMNKDINRDMKVIKNQILKYLCEDFEGNQAIFNKQQGWQVFYGTDLTMVMDKVVAGLKSSQELLSKEID